MPDEEKIAHTDELRQNLAGQALGVTALTEDVVFVSHPGGAGALAFGNEQGELKKPSAQWE